MSRKWVRRSASAQVGKLIKKEQATNTKLSYLLALARAEGQPEAASCEALLRPGCTCASWPVIPGAGSSKGVNAILCHQRIMCQIIKPWVCYMRTWCLKERRQRATVSHKDCGTREEEGMAYSKFRFCSAADKATCQAAGSLSIATAATESLKDGSGK